MISRQLGAMYPRAIANIADAARTLDGPHDRLKDYFKAYIFDPIRAIEYPYQLVVVVDGLDEWRNYESFLAELVHIPSPSLVKFVLTSRFNYSIERAVDKMPTRKYPLPPASQRVIEHYFHQHFLSGDINWRGRKPDDNKIHRLAARADGLLIWAATARLLVTNKFDTRYPHEILDQILSSEEKVVNQKDGGEDGQLERLYRGAISTLFPPHIRGMLRKFLAATVVLREALPIGDFAHLSGIPGPAAEEIHQRLAALQTQGDPQTNLIPPATQRFHTSFVEFITTESDDQTFPAINTTEAHYMLANRCLEIVFVELLPSFRGKTCTYRELLGVEPYAVKFWPLHFSSGTPRQQLTPPSGAVGMNLISEDAMRHWATLFLPCIAARFQDGHNSLHGMQKSVLPYKVAVMIGMEDVTTLSYHIQCLEIAARLQPLDMGVWKALGVAYRRLHEQSQANRDLDEEITAFRHGLEPAPHPDRSGSLNNLANALQTRFNQRGASNDLDEGIYLHREALLLRPAPHPGRPTLLNNLAEALQTRFKQRGASNDLDETISLHQEALLLRPARHPDRPMSLNNLAEALRTRFEQQGASNDLDEAIFLHQEALLLRPAPHPDHSMSLHNLAGALQTRFIQRGASNDLDEAISLHGEALLLLPAPHPARSMSLNNLAIALKTRFEQRGAPNDIDEAISLHREALLLRPAPHPARSMSLNNLGNALQTRFEQRGASNDLDETISLHREALLLRPAPHPDRSMSLKSLADSLQARFEQGGAPNDLDETISLHREALLLRPAPHPDRFASLNNFAYALLTRFEQRGAPNDIDEAISLCREALLLQLAHHPRYSNLLQGLAIALRMRFDQGHLLHDITEVISLYERLLDCPVQDPNRSWALKRLHAALRERQALIGDHVDIVKSTDAGGRSLM
jgi:tetratricopeptide (TPR) repeat protein